MSSLVFLAIQFLIRLLFIRALSYFFCPSSPSLSSVQIFGFQLMLLQTCSDNRRNVLLPHHVPLTALLCKPSNTQFHDITNQARSSSVSERRLLREYLQYPEWFLSRVRRSHGRCNACDDHVGCTLRSCTHHFAPARGRA